MKPGTDEEADVADILARLEAAVSAGNGTEEEALLTSIRPVLAFSETRLKYKESLERCNLVVLFQCLGLDEAAREAAAQVLGKILEFLDPAATLNKYSAQLDSCLSQGDLRLKAEDRQPHPGPLVALRFLGRCLGLAREDPAVRQSLLADKGLLAKAVRNLAASRPAELVRESKRFLHDLANLDGGGDVVFSSPVLPVLLELKEDPDAVVRLRVLEAMVQVATLSPELTERAAAAGFLAKLYDEEMQKSDDVLVQLNALEILADLAQVPHGMDHLMDRQIFAKLDRMLVLDPASTSLFLTAGFLKFFGLLAHRKPDLFMENYPNFAAVLLNLVSGQDSAGQDPEMVALATATLGYIASTVAGKKKLLESGMAETLAGRISAFLRHGKTEHKILALHATAQVLGTRGLEGDGDDLTWRLYKLLISKLPDLPKRVQDTIRLPFDDLAASGYEVLIAAVDKAWGLEELVANQPGMIEYLLDRRSASSRDAKLKRYKVIQEVVANAANSNLVPPELLVRLKGFLDEGPFYVEPEAAVALDEGC